MAAPAPLGCLACAFQPCRSDAWSGRRTNCCPLLLQPASSLTPYDPTQPATYDCCYCPHPHNPWFHEFPWKRGVGRGRGGIIALTRVNPAPPARPPTHPPTQAPTSWHKQPTHSWPTPTSRDSSWVSTHLHGLLVHHRHARELRHAVLHCCYERRGVPGPGVAGGSPGGGAGPGGRAGPNGWALRGGAWRARGWGHMHSPCPGGPSFVCCKCPSRCASVQLRSAPPPHTHLRNGTPPPCVACSWAVCMHTHATCVRRMHTCTTMHHAHVCACRVWSNAG